MIPLDPFSEVVDQARRWTKEWYSWLLGLSEELDARAPRAWAAVTFSGGTPSFAAQHGFTGTPLDNSTGDTTLTLSTPMSSMSYAIIGSQEDIVAGFMQAIRVSASTFTIRTFDSTGTTPTDSDFFVTVFGDQ